MDIWALLNTYWPTLIDGLLLTLNVSISSFAIALLIAFVTAPLAAFGPRYIRISIKLYVDIFRGLPELLIIFLFYYGGTVALTRLSGHYFEVSAIAAGITALSMVAGAYLSEILRAALLSIAKGQWEASYVLGLSPIKTFILVILPQTLQRAAPGMANQWLISLKESALVSVIGLEELMRVTVVSAGATQQPLAFYVIAAAFYLLVTSASQVMITFVGIKTQQRRC